MSNINIEYSYKTPEDIMESITPLLQFSVIEMILMVICIAFTIALVLFIIPSFYSFSLRHKKALEKKKRKLSLEQILVTKEIEQEIEDEIRQEQEEKLRAKE